MLGIGKDWIDWKCYSVNGIAFFGINSVPVNVKDNVYQIKCMCGKTLNRSQYEMRYLQFDLDKTGLTLDFLNSLQNEYIKEMQYSGYHTDNERVHIVGEVGKPKNKNPHPYDAKNVHSLFTRLCKLKKQEKYNIVIKNSK